MSTIDREIICIVCPTGCRIQVSGGKQQQLTVSGNECKRGEEYALKEITDPRRILITTVQISHGGLKRLPVRTNREIPKESIFPCMKVINRARVEAPVDIGQVIIPDILGTGADVVATRSMGRRPPRGARPGEPAGQAPGSGASQRRMTSSPHRQL